MMDLREKRAFFAGLAMHAMIVAETEAAKNIVHAPTGRKLVLVRDAWEWADLMIAEEVTDENSPLAAGLKGKG
jgi:hypothetical protein